jgi:cysteine-rich repeat protein
MGKRTDRRNLLVGILAPLLLGALAPAALAGVDASGPWGATITTSPPPISFSCTFLMAQAGAALSASVSCPTIAISLRLTGTIDSTTGAFTLSGFEPTFCDNTVTFSGTVAQDARTFTAVAECPVSSFPYPVDVAGSRCGNGVLDPGEVCDDGNQLNGDCCSATCDAAAPEGTICGFAGPCGAQECNASGTCQFVTFEGTCDDSNDCTTNDTCTDGFCQGQPVADGTTCDDFNQCTTSDVCTDGFCSGQPVECGPCQECDFFEGCIAEEPAFFCSSVPPGRSTLRVRDDPTDKKDVVSWRLQPDAGISIGDFGDPRSFTSYQLCVFDNVFGSNPFLFGDLLAGVKVPAGGTCGSKPCWTPKRNGYSYTDKSGASDGVRSLDLEAGDSKSAALSIFAKGPSVGIAPLPAELPVVVQLQSSDGFCWQADFADARLNGPLELQARIAGSPSGAFVD